MDIQPVEQLERLLSPFNLKTEYVTREHPDISDISDELRSTMNMPSADEGVLQMENYLDAGVLYVATDMLCVHRMLFLLPEEYSQDGEKTFLVIGPYIDEPAEDILLRVMPELAERGALHSDMVGFYNNISYLPSSDAIEELIMIQLSYIWGDSLKIQVRHADWQLDESFGSELSDFDFAKINAESIERRYQVEREMLAAVQSGNLEKVNEVRLKFQQYRLEPRISDSLRNTKNLMVIMNTLFRKSVEQGHVHPVHIDRLSEQFAVRIEQAASIAQLDEIGDEMVRKYCMLVRNHSQREYSPIIASARDYIDFHLDGELSLSSVASELNITSNYLSTLFKKETGSTITDYINETRIHSSLLLLATTSLPIQELASRVGILDENYFSRLFKKYQKMTPREYRTMIRAERV